VVRELMGRRLSRQVRRAWGAEGVAELEGRGLLLGAVRWRCACAELLVALPQRPLEDRDASNTGLALTVFFKCTLDCTEAASSPSSNKAAYKSLPFFFF